MDLTLTQAKKVIVKKIKVHSKEHNDYFKIKIYVQKGDSEYDRDSITIFADASENIELVVDNQAYEEN